VGPRVTLLLSASLHSLRCILFLSVTSLIFEGPRETNHRTSFRSPPSVFFVLQFLCCPASVCSGRVLTLKCKLQELNTKCANATRIEGLYNVEVEKVAKMLGGCEQKSLLCSLTFNSRAVTTMPHRLVDRLHSDDNLKSKDPEQTQQPQKRQRVAAPVSNTVGNEDKESCTLMRGPETNRGGIGRTRQAARLSKNCSSPLDVRIKRMECPRS